MTWLCCHYCQLWKHLKLFLVFHSWISRTVAGWVYQQRSKYSQVKIIEPARTDANYAILTKLTKPVDEKKPASNLLSTQSVGFEQTFMIFFLFFFFNWDSLHARLNSRYQAWSYKKEITKKITGYRKSVQKEPTVKRCLLILDLKPLRS